MNLQESQKANHPTRNPGSFFAHMEPHSGTGQLRRDVIHLAEAIGPRNIYHYENLNEALRFIAKSFIRAGLRPILQTYFVKGKKFANIEVEILGTSRSDEILVVGAHYDTHKASPGANDNASAIAALLELARYFGSSKERPSRTLRLVAFTNEEAPFTRRKSMGSRVYASDCRRRGDKIVGMICLETIGCFRPEPGSQKLSLGGRLLPTRGNFLALVGNTGSRRLLEEVEGALSRNSRIAFESVTLPQNVPGAFSSDHWSFWQEGFPAIMVTDTAPLRYDPYHTSSDTPEKVDYEWLDLVVEGLKNVIEDLIHSDKALSIDRMDRVVRKRVREPLGSFDKAVLGVFAGLISGYLVMRMRSEMRESSLAPHELM
jgi:hypothetical protein